jgi:membrane protein
MWKLLKTTVLSFIEDEALSRGAAIAFYTVTSLAPILLIVIAIAGLAFGQEAARDAITAQLTGLMGEQTADVLQSAIAGASDKSAGILATVIGIVTLIATASGVFGEMQTALNKVWDAEPRASTVSRLIRARATSLGLVAALGFLLLVSLVVSTVLSALSDYLNAVLPFGGVILSALNFIVSLALISVLFAAIYKVLPDRPIAWRDVITGAVVTALLFTAGKSLIGWYLGSSAVASSYGAAGGLIILLLWVYYSAQIFLLGAEFTRAYASHRQGKAGEIPARGDFSRPGGPEAGTKGRRTSSFDGNSISHGQTMTARNGTEPSLSELEGDAERNRAALVDTVGALHQRLSPTAIKHDVQDYVRKRKDGFIESLEQRARENPLQTVALAAGAAYPLFSIARRIPVPILLIGAGLALARRSNGGQPSIGEEWSDQTRGQLDRAADTARKTFGDVSAAVQEQAQEGMATARRAADRLSGLTSQAAQNASDFAARVGEKVAGTAETIRGVGSDAASLVTAERVQHAGRQSAEWVNDTVRQNPLVVGAVGLAVGAVIAAALPKTRQEDEYLGAAARGVRRRAQEAARAGVEAVKDAGAEIYRDVSRDAEQQGLSVEGVKDAAGDVAEKIRTAALNATGSQNQTQNPDDASSKPQSQQQW